MALKFLFSQITGKDPLWQDTNFFRKSREKCLCSSTKQQGGFLSNFPGGHVEEDGAETKSDGHMVVYVADT